MVHVGAGWALAQLRLRVDRALARLDPLLGWLAVNGYGFHHGYFHGPRRWIASESRVGSTGYARRVFDQGLGRSLWFVEGAEVARIAATIARFPASRHADLWSGVGLACAYAGGVAAEAIEDLERDGGCRISPSSPRAWPSPPRPGSGPAIPHLTPNWRAGSSAGCRRGGRGPDGSAP